MNKIEELRRVLQRMDHKSYGMYKSLAGAYDCGRYVLHIDHVQGDPFASPSRLRFEVKKAAHGFPEEYWKEKHRRLALEDQVLRRFNGFLRKMDRGNMGSGKSGRITTCRTGQKVLERIAVVFSENRMELRFEMGFPARGRSILADEMSRLLFDILPKLFGKTAEPSESELSELMTDTIREVWSDNRKRLNDWFDKLSAVTTEEIDRALKQDGKLDRAERDVT